MLGMIIKIIISIGLSLKLYTIIWWAPILIFPLLVLISPSFGFGGGDYSKIKRKALMARRAIYYLVILGFIVLMSYIFHINIGSWYGWLIGMVLAGLGHFFVASGLEEYLFFHAADIEALKAANGKTGSKLE